MTAFLGLLQTFSATSPMRGAPAQALLACGPVTFSPAYFKTHRQHNCCDHGCKTITPWTGQILMTCPAGASDTTTAHNTHQHVNPTSDTSRHRLQPSGLVVRLHNISSSLHPHKQRKHSPQARASNASPTLLTCSALRPTDAIGVLCHICRNPKWCSPHRSHIKHRV